MFIGRTEEEITILFCLMLVEPSKGKGHMHEGDVDALAWSLMGQLLSVFG